MIHSIIQFILWVVLFLTVLTVILAGITLVGQSLIVFYFTQKEEYQLRMIDKDLAEEQEAFCKKVVH